MITVSARRSFAGLAIVLSLLLGLLAGCATPVSSGSDTDPESGLPLVELAELPEQVAETAALIASDGPFPYAKDGSVFGNREGLLPDRPRGYYREYTVPTPGESDRGARRIVGGDQDRILYYTGDHYASFVRIRS